MRSGEIRAGLAILALLWGLALLAPLLASDVPWIQRTEGRLYLPLLARLPLVGGWVEARPPTPGPDDLVIWPPVPYDPNRIDLGAVLRPPGRDHPLGTDALGRDLAARILHGARRSLWIGGAGTVGALLVGLVLGGWAGYRGGWSDRLVSALIDVALSFPSLLLALALVAVTGARGPWSLVLVLALTRWARIARYARAEFLRLREAPLVSAARAVGAGEGRILAIHLLPHALAPILVTAAFTAAGAVLLEAALGFLGMGVAPPDPSWGGILAEARQASARAWWLSLAPGAMIFAALAGYGLLGEGLLARLDPRRVAARGGGTPARSAAL